MKEPGVGWRYMSAEACTRFSSAINSIIMSATDILSQLPRLTPAERDAVRSRLDAIDSSAPLSSEEKRLIAERVAAYRQHPGATVSWAVAESDIRKKLGF